MATKLENLKIRKVDFVDEGANPRADIKFFKRKQPGEAEAPSQDQIADTLAKKLSESILGLFGRQAGAKDVEKGAEVTEKLKTQEGEQLKEMVKIDKSKMTPEERAAYEEMIQKYAVEMEEDPVGKKGEPSGTSGKEKDEDEIGDEDDEEEAKKKQDKKKTMAQKSVAPAQEDDDIYKGIHPMVKAEIEALKKFREEKETQELEAVAKKYEIIGKKPEELVPTLKSLRAAGGTAYNDMIGILDAAVNVVEQSGAFNEIGKSGHGGTVATEAEAIEKAKAKAAEIKKARPELTEAQAMDEALLANPELRKELDK